ncbi:MAG TPA: hemolysin family protein [Amaricoccus sp.]|nr:hemolysin family protein [Amaricoccus sp.]
MLFSIVIVLVLVVLNGFFAMSELATVSARRSRLETMARAGSSGAARALKLAEDPTGFLSTVQIGITLIGIFAGAYSGATLSQPLADALRQIPALASIAGTLAFALVVVATTYVSLIIGELVPKRLALRNAEGIAAFVSGPMTFLAAVGKPIVWFLRVSTEAVLGLLRLRGEAPSSVTEEEVKAMIAEGTDAGVFHEAERELLEGVIRFADRPLRSIMVPRHAMVWIDVNDPLDEALTEILDSGHSRFPLCDGSIDKVIGFLHVKDILEMQRSGGSDLRPLAREPLYVSESIPALRMIELFRASGIHMAMVVDEYGSLEGLVMPTDILTGIAGDLPDLGEEAPGAVQRDDGSWLLDGSLPVDTAARVLEAEDMQPEDYSTLAGMIIEELGHIPTPGENVTLHGWCFEVVDLDGRRIDKVLARRP